MIFTDMLGQSFIEGDRFMLLDDSNEYDYSIRYGVVSKVTEKDYTLLFDEGSGSKRGSTRNYKSNLLVNYQAIIDAHPERFL